MPTRVPDRSRLWVVVGHAVFLAAAVYVALVLLDDWRLIPLAFVAWVGGTLSPYLANRYLYPKYPQPPVDNRRHPFR